MGSALCLYACCLSACLRQVVLVVTLQQAAMACLALYSSVSFLQDIPALVCWCLSVLKVMRLASCCYLSSL